MAGAGDGQRVAVDRGAQERERGRAELARRVVAEDRLVHHLQHALGERLVARRDPHRMAGQGGQRGGGRALARDVADRERKSVGNGPGVVEVASDLGSLPAAR